MTKINTRMALSTAAIVVTNAMMLGSANAAVVIWGTASNFQKASDVINNGNVVQASAVAAATVNGVVFTSSTFITVGGYTATATATFQNAVIPADTEYDKLVGKQAYISSSPGTNTTGTISLTGLTDGQQYIFQHFAVDDRNVQKTNTYTMGSTGGTDSASITRGDIDGTDLTGGKTIFGTFTAIGTTQNIFVKSVSTRGATTTGYVLSTVPEPSSTALLGLGGLALILRRRRK